MSPTVIICLCCIIEKCCLLLGTIWSENSFIGHINDLNTISYLQILKLTNKCLCVASSFKPDSFLVVAHNSFTIVLTIFPVDFSLQKWLPNENGEPLDENGWVYFTVPREILMTSSILTVVGQFLHLRLWKLIVPNPVEIAGCPRFASLLSLTISCISLVSCLCSASAVHKSPSLKIHK